MLNTAAYRNSLSGWELSTFRSTKSGLTPITPATKYTRYHLRFLDNCMLSVRSDVFDQDMIHVMAEMIRDMVKRKLGIPTSTELKEQQRERKESMEFKVEKEAKDGKDEKEEKKEKSPVERGPLSLMVDGSCDSAKQEQEIVCVKGVVNGEASTHFLCVRAVRDGTAEVAEAMIDALLSEMAIDPNRVFSLGTDGAGPMTGEHTGLGARLRRKFAFLLQHHCVCHR